jgi:rRNA small subunit pseudouridine methyltransferase Nep1
MIGLDEEEKRGRPDIIHFCLLESMGSPLNREGNLSIAIHTIRGTSIEVDPETRLPRDAYRFRSLIEHLLVEGQVPPPPAKPLLKADKETLHEMKEKVNPSLTIALTSHGTPTTLENLCEKLAKERNPLAFIGAYPHGEYRKETLAEADETYSIYPEPLEAWVVTSRFIYEYEKQLKALREATRTP